MLKKIQAVVQFVCRQSALEQIVRAPVILASNAQVGNVARIAQSETRGQNWIRFNFGVKQSPRNAAFLALWADQT